MTLPNQLTLLRMALTPAFVILMYYDEFPYHELAAFLVFLFASLTDAYDGYVARKFGSVTKWGGFLDPLADKILMGAAFFTMAAKGYLKLWMVLIMVIRDALITLIRTYAFWKKKPMRTETLAKWKTTFQMILIIALLIYGNLINNPFGYSLSSDTVASIEESGIIDTFTFFVMLLTVYSGAMYIIGNRKYVRQAVVGVYRAIVQFL